MASDNGDASSDFLPRDYQIEIFEEACRQNVVVCLGTGTGKTFISVLLIKELAHQIKGKLSEGGKRTFFLVTTVPLVHQQSKAIEDRTFLKVGKYTGDMGVDFWDKEDWKKEFNAHDVLVMTHQILLDMLQHNYLLPSNINLLVLDECHHTNKNHPYAQIMKRIEDFSIKPRVMGLTASIINEKVKNKGISLRHHLEERMKELEINLRAVCFTCADQSSTSSYATKPKESIKGYPDLEFDDSQFYQIYTQISDLLKFNGEMPNSKEEKEAYKKCVNALRDLQEILDFLGGWCTYKAAIVIKENIEKEKDSFHRIGSEWLDYVVQIAEDIIHLFEHYAVSQFGGIESILLMMPLITPKVMTLMDLLVDNKKDLCAIVFVKKRITAHVLSDLINNLVTCYEHYEGIVSDFVYGHNLVGIFTQKELCSMTSKNQEKILRRFRSMEFNVLVATSVVEEGLDVRKCNLVVRFDGLQNYREYVQSKGRARAKNSKFVILSRQEEIESTEYQLERMREVEQILIEKSRGRELPTEEEIAEYRVAEQLIEPFRISDEEGAAEINRNNAMQLLHIYCSKLPSGQYTSLRPTFKIQKHADYGEFMAIVSLPINCPVRETIEGDWLPTEKLARISAAKEACVRLWKAKELDDYFVPIKRNYESDETDEDEDEVVHAGSACMSTPFVYQRKIPDCFEFEGPFPSSGLYLYALEIVLEKPKTGQESLWNIWYRENRRQYGLLVARPLPKVPCFPLFTQAGEVRVSVKLQEGDVCLDRLELECVKSFHKSAMTMFAGDFASGRSFSLDNAKSKALLVVLASDSHSLTKRKKQLFDCKFMSEVCDDHFYPADGDLDDAVISKTYLGDRKSLYYVAAVRNDILITDRIAAGKVTFEEYYRNKYGKIISQEQPLLQSVHASTRINYTAPRYSSKEWNSSKSASVEFLVPELCQRKRIPASFHCQSVCVPSLLFRLETLLAAEELRQLMIRDISPSHLNCRCVNKKERECFDEIMRKPKKKRGGVCRYDTNFEREFENLKLDDACGNLGELLHGKNHGRDKCVKLEVVLQSLTTAKANAGFDLERLETLGDSFLKVATSIYLFYKYPMKYEGRLTEKRKQLVCNKKLLKVAKQKDLQHVMCNTSFGVKLTGKDEDTVYDHAKTLWLPPMFAEVLSHSSSEEEKVPVAPCHIIRDKSLADAIEALIGAFLEHDGVNGALKLMQWFGIDCFRSSLTLMPAPNCNSAYADFDLPHAAIYEENAENRAFVTRQYKKMRLSAVEKTINYEFKDKSFLVQAFTHMSYHLNKVTGCYQRLEFLGDAVLDFLIVGHLCSNNGDLDPSSLTDIKSALVNNNTFALLSLKYRLHKGLMRLESKLDSVLSRFGDLTKEEINDNFKSPFMIRLTSDDDPDEGYHAPKVLGDIFESLAGAVFLDSGLDFLQVWRVFYPILKPLIDAYVENVPLNPVRAIKEKYPQASYRFENMTNGKCMCFWRIDEKEFYGIGQNRKMAQGAAAQKALLEV
eukprot:gene2763-983_t